jgi:general secretion pathway protein G
MILKKQAQAATRAAFTLMEMLVVVAILVVLAGAAVPIYLNYLENAKRDRAKVDVTTLQTAIEAFKAEYGDYPPSLQTLTQADQATGNFATLEPKALMDPWNQQYQYEPQNKNPATGRPKIYSGGPPGQNRPIANW